VISAVSYVERVNTSVVGDLMMHDLHMSQVQVGRVFSAFILGYALFQFPAGALADRFGSRRVLGGALLCWGGFTILTALVDRLIISPWLGVLNTLLTIRFLFGVSESPTFPAAARTLSKWVGASEQARANALVLAGIGIGSALTPPILAHLMVYLGWQKALMLASIPAFAMAAIWLAFSRDEPPHIPFEPVPFQQMGHKQGNKSSHPELRQAGLGIVGDRNLWFLTLSYSLQGYVSYVFVFWFFLYLVQVRHFDVLHSSWLATMPWILTLITTPVGGALSDWLAARLGYPWGRRILPMVAMVSAGVLLSFGAREARPYLAVAFLTLCEALVMSVEGGFWASAIEISGRQPGAAGGVMNMGGNLGGFLSPLATPLIAARFGWITALNVAAGISVLSGLLWLWIASDRQKFLRK